MVSDNKTDIDKNKHEGQKKKKSNICNPNPLSRLFIWWMCPVLINGNKRDVEEEDLVDPGKKYRSERVGDYLEE